jgi:hypothetical protein
MNKRLCYRTVIALAIAVGLMPLAASASTILSLGGFENTGQINIGSVQTTADMIFTTLTYGSTSLTGDFSESYEWTSGGGGVMVTSETAFGNFSAGETLVTIDEGG